MANLIIRPATGAGNKVVVQDQAGAAVLTTADSGATLSNNTQDNITRLGTVTAAVLGAGVTGGSGLTALGTVATGNLSNSAIIMPRFKEFDRFHYDTTTNTSSVNQGDVNISGSHYVTVTPEHANDIIEFGYEFNIWLNTGKFGWGIEKDTATNFSSSLSAIYRSGHHSWQHSPQDYAHVGAVISQTAGTYGMSAGTTYYCRMIGLTHSEAGSWDWGAGSTNALNGGRGVQLTMKRWSIV